MIIHSNSDDYNKKMIDLFSVDSCHFTVLYIIIVLLSYQSRGWSFLVNVNKISSGTAAVTVL